MKKKIILYIGTIIFMLVIIFMNESYAKTTNTKTFKGFLYDNEDHIYTKEGSSELYVEKATIVAQNFSIEEDTRKNLLDIRFNWLHAVEDMRKYIVGNTDVHYYDIASSVSVDMIKKAQEAVNKCRNNLNMDNLNGEIIRKITGYKDRTSYGKALNDLYKELTAAYYSASGEARNGVNITDSYVTKFKYTKAQWEEYMKIFGPRYNLSGEERDTIINILGIKTAADENSSLATRTDLYVAKNDSFETMMGYDKDQIDLYITLWGKYPYPDGSSENGPRDGVMVEWAYVLDHDGQHSPFYNKSFDGKSFHTPIVTNYDKNRKCYWFY